MKTNFVRFHSACSVSGGSVPDPPPDGPSPIGAPHPRTQAGCKLAFGRFHLSLLNDERESDRNQRRRTRLQERVQAFADAHALTPEQQTTLTLVFEAEQEEERQAFREARDTENFDGVRAKVGEIRAHTDDNMKAVLDPQQLEAFAKMRAEDSERQRGFGGGGFGGGGFGFGGGGGRADARTP